MKSENQKESIQRKLLLVLDLYRGLILDAVEQELGESDNWTFVRGRLLKSLGDRGLAGRIREVLTEEFQTNGGGA